MSNKMPKQNQIIPDLNPYSKLEHFEVVWKDLEYKVKRHVFSNQKTIINKINGHFRSGQIMAVMGPSGCGKSSLLGCLSATKKRGITGTITISTKQKVI